MKNTILKAITYRIIIILSQLTLLYLITGNIRFSFEFSMLFGIVATIEYIILEILWKKK